MSDRDRAKVHIADSLERLALIDPLTLTSYPRARLRLAIYELETCSRMLRRETNDQAKTRRAKLSALRG